MGFDPGLNDRDYQVISAIRWTVGRQTEHRVYNNGGVKFRHRLSYLGLLLEVPRAPHVGFWSVLYAWVCMRAKSLRQASGSGNHKAVASTLVCDTSRRVEVLGVR